LIARHVGTEVDTSELQIQRDICCLTGLETDCVPVKQLITSSFTDGARFRAPSSAWIGLDVYQSWKYGFRGEGKKQYFCPERMSCWYVDDSQFQYQINKIRIRDVALKGGVPPWAMWVTTSYKKHGSLRATLNNKLFGRVAFDNVVADCSDSIKTLEWYSRILDIQSKGFNRFILESLDCPVHVLKKNDHKEWDVFYRWAKPIYMSPLYKFLCYLLPSKEELNAEEPMVATGLNPTCVPCSVETQGKTQGKSAQMPLF